MGGSFFPIKEFLIRIFPHKPRSETLDLGRCWWVSIRKFTIWQNFTIRQTTFLKRSHAALNIRTDCTCLKTYMYTISKPFTLWLLNKIGYLCQVWEKDNTCLCKNRSVFSILEIQANKVIKSSANNINKFLSFRAKYIIFSFSQISYLA